MTDLEYSNACTEVLEIIKYFPDEDVEKIPKSLILSFETYKNKSYKPKFNFRNSLDLIGLDPNAKAMLGIIFENYWCPTDEERDKFEAKITGNGKWEELNDANVENSDSSVGIIKPKNPSILDRIIEFFRKIFNKG